VENISPNTFFVLERVMQEAHLYQAIAMCSLGMLPKDATYRHALLEQCTRAGVSVHFVFEQVIIDSPNDIESLDELLSLTNLAPSDLEQIRHIFDLIKRQ